MVFFLFIDSGKWAQLLPWGWVPGMISFSPQGAHWIPSCSICTTRWGQFLVPTAVEKEDGRQHCQKNRKKNWGKMEGTQWSPCEHAIPVALQIGSNKPSLELVRNRYCPRKDLLVTAHTCGWGAVEQVFTISGFKTWDIMFCFSDSVQIIFTFQIVFKLSSSITVVWVPLQTFLLAGKIAAASALPGLICTEQLHLKPTYRQQLCSKISMQAHFQL